jgi:hypothetical protein
LTRDSTNGTSDVYYNELDTGNSDSLSSTINLTDASGVTKTDSFIGQDLNFISITVSTTGVVYANAIDGNAAGDQSYVLKCSSSCTTVSNWSDSNAPLADSTTGCTITNSRCNTNEIAMQPLSGGDILLVEYNQVTAGTNNPTTANIFASRVYHSGTGLWDRGWTVIDNNAPYNGSGASNYPGSWSTTVDKLTGAVYLIYTAKNNALGTDDEIRTAIYYNGFWTAKSNVITGGSAGITSAKVSIDEGTGDIYCVYASIATATANGDGQILWKKSTDGMLSWGTAQGPISTTNTFNDLHALSLNFMSNERIYADWVLCNTALCSSSSQSGTILAGATVIDLTASSNHTPDAPILSSPASGEKTSTLPQFRMQARDGDGDYLKYKIEICADSSCSSILQTIDQTSSPTGWTNQDTQSNTAYKGSRPYYLSSMAIHELTTSLSVNTQYWWRAYAIDPTPGSNTFSAASSISTFTTTTSELQIRGGTTIQGGTTL